jgi:hypothetical protein
MIRMTTLIIDRDGCYAFKFVVPVPIANQARWTRDGEERQEKDKHTRTNSTQREKEERKEIGSAITIQQLFQVPRHRLEASLV